MWKFTDLCTTCYQDVKKKMTETDLSPKYA